MTRYFTHIVRSIIWFSVACALLSCSSTETDDFTLNWKDGKAVSLTMPFQLTEDPETIQVTLGVEGATPILGEFEKQDNQYVFVPLVPFTRGMHYHILVNGKIVGEISVPLDTESKKPALTIYPSSDTLPANMLKMYFVFTEPMVEGQSLQHVHLLNSQGDTLAGTFLDLKPELWNTEGTILTLWLDPGRIKRDLIPNKEMGNPLIEGDTYKLRVSNQWQSKTGLPLSQSYSKAFVVSGRDEEIPNVNSWKLTIPTSGTTASLTINFLEPLDYMLIQSTIRVLNGKGETVMGQVQVIDKERKIVFTPTRSWAAGVYRLHVESKLEDLAGNNLSRPFDRDLKKSGVLKEKVFYEREFIIP